LGLKRRGAQNTVEHCGKQRAGPNSNSDPIPQSNANPNSDAYRMHDYCCWCKGLFSSFRQHCDLAGAFQRGSKIDPANHGNEDIY
jgi:hypothetical protein